MEVNYRTLRYPASWPQGRAQEKGIDVLMALDPVQKAQAGSFDVLVLASHDTDLEPALELASRAGRTTIETAGWEGAKRLRVPGKPSGTQRSVPASSSTAATAETIGSPSPRPQRHDRGGRLHRQERRVVLGPAAVLVAPDPLAVQVDRGVDGGVHHPLLQLMDAVALAQLGGAARAGGALGVRGRCRC